MTEVKKHRKLIESTANLMVTQCIGAARNVVWDEMTYEQTEQYINDKLKERFVFYLEQQYDIGEMDGFLKAVKKM